MFAPSCLQPRGTRGSGFLPGTSTGCGARPMPLTLQSHLLGTVVVDHGQEGGPIAAISHQILQQREVGWLPRRQVLSAVAHLQLMKGKTVSTHDVLHCHLCHRQTVTSRINTMPSGQCSEQQPPHDKSSKCLDHILCLEHICQDPGN